MKAIQFETFGDADVLRIAETPDPELRSTDLLVQVGAAGVNRADLTLRRGGYGRPDFGDSSVMGLEIAGVVLAVGSETKGFAPGDRVMGVVGGGAYAQVARIDYRMAMKVPDELNILEAAAIPEVFVTAHEALIHLGQAQAGDIVLVHAAAGGVGSAVVQLAHATGATVIATTTASKLAGVKGLGADHVVDYEAEDFAEAVAKITNGRGVDVVVDFVGGPYFERNVNSLTYGGRLVQVGLLGGAEASIPLETLLYRHLRIIGTVMKSRSQEVKHAMTARFHQHWLPKFESGQLKPVIDSIYPLAQASDAHLRMEGGDGFGKIILQVI